MKIEKVGFIGAGRVVRLLLDGLERAGSLPGKVVVCDPDRDALEILLSRHPSVEAVDPPTAASADVVFLAVHPPDMEDAVSKAAGGLGAESHLVSLAPVWTIRRLEEKTDGYGKITRMIPNAPSLVGRGYNPVAFGKGVSEADKQVLLDLFSLWGPCPEVAEESLELYAVIAAMGPTYLWPLLLALEDLGREFGLDREAARAAVAHMAEGTAAVLGMSELSDEEIMDLIPVKPLQKQTSLHLEKCHDTLAELVKKLERAR